MIEGVDNVWLDIRDRLARIEVKFDNTRETLMSHEKRIGTNEDDIEKLKTEHAAFRAKIATYVQVAGGIGIAGAIVAWIVDHASTVVAVASAVPH